PSPPSRRRSGPRARRAYRGPCHGRISPISLNEKASGPVGARLRFNETQSCSRRRAMNAPQILVDADACPVKDEILRVAARHGLEVTLVANRGLRPSRDPLVVHVLVPQGADAADDWIAECAHPGAIVVTADIPLAGRCLRAGA